MPRAPPPLLLLLDFDSTLTSSCTLPHFLSIPTTIHSSVPPSSKPLHPPASCLASLYASDLAAHRAAHPSLASSNHRLSTLTSELVWQDSIRPIEHASFQRGVQAFTNIGIDSRQIRDEARRAVAEGRVEMRMGWKRLLRMAHEQQGLTPVKVSIVSVAWSPDWVIGVLEGDCMRGKEEKEEEEKSEGENQEGEQEKEENEEGDVEADVAVDRSSMDVRVHVRCNNVLSPMHSSERIRKGKKREANVGAGIFVASDKLTVMQELKAAHSTDGEEAWTIYIGDSLTDIECLLAAEVGIVIRDEETMRSEQEQLKKALRSSDISTYHIGDFGGIQIGEGETALWWASDFDEVIKSGCLDVKDQHFPSKAVY